VEATSAAGEWCVIANIKAEAFGRATSPGTKHFVAGTRIWAVAWYWGQGGENVRVLGRRDQIAHLDLALRLMRDDPRGQQLAAAATAVLGQTEPSANLELFVLLDWLEDHGASLRLAKLAETLRRRRDNA
jgi:hypothetical protein